MKRLIIFLLLAMTIAAAVCLPPIHPPGVFDSATQITLSENQNFIAVIMTLSCEPLPQPVRCRRQGLWINNNNHYNYFPVPMSLAKRKT